jgi:hypothetical protein
MRTFTRQQNQPRSETESSILTRPRTATPGPHRRAGLILRGHDFSRVPARSAIQTKLAVNKPGDEYEQEADRVAEQVMRMPVGPASHQASVSSQAQDAEVQRKCRKCDEEDEGVLQKSAASGPPAVAHGPSHLPPVVGQVLSSPGEPLDAATRAFMEPRFGADFSKVRIHADSAAATSAQAINAHAYTVGEQIAFSRGRYAPRTEEGRRLLAHELAHVMQQNAISGAVIRRQTATPAEPRPNPAEYQWVPFHANGTWDAPAILSRISQREQTETRTFTPLPGTGKESDEVRCAANATLATAVAAGPRAVARMCVNLYKHITAYRDRNKGSKQSDVISESVSNRALSQIFSIARNVEFCMGGGSREGGACTMTFADFDRLANWLYVFSYNSADEGRRLGREGIGDIRGEKARFRTDAEIAESAKLAGYDKGEGRYRVKDEADLDAQLARLKPGESLLGLWGPHTYTFFRNKTDGELYLYDSWRPGATIHVRGSEGYNTRVQDGLTRTEKSMVLLLGRYYDTNKMFGLDDYNKGGLYLSPPPRL